MRTEEKQQKWLEAMREKGHEPVMDEGGLDYFVMESGYCNGPGCAVCGWKTCWHCHDVSFIPTCNKNY